MSVIKNIKIFAAFDNDVEEDVTRFGDFLCALNAQCKNIEFSIFKDEKELCEYLEHPKEKINGELDTCEYFLLILGSKNNDYVLNKLYQAIENYSKTHGNPDIHIFVNASKEGSDSTRKYFSSEKFEHFVEQFKHIDTLKAKFLTWLSAKEKDFTYEVDVDNHGSPVIKVGGYPVSGLVDFDALLNNEDYQDEKKKLIRNRSKREKYVEELRNAEGDERNDLWDDISALTKEIEEQQDKVSKMEKDTLALYQNYAKMTLESGYNSRLKRALECIEQGDLDRARKVLDPDGSLNNLKALENENELLAARVETNKKIAEQEINILFAEIDRLNLDTDNKNRFDEIEKCYENIEHFQEKFGLEITVLNNYAYFLESYHKFNSALEKYSKEYDRCKKYLETNPDTYLFKLAMTFDNIISMQFFTGYNEKTKELVQDMIEIYDKLAQAAKEANSLGKTNILVKHLSIMTMILQGVYKFSNIDAYIIRAIENYRWLDEIEPNIYLNRLADALSSLAWSSIFKDKLKAEENYSEAINIYRKLIKFNDNKDVYLHKLAKALDNISEFVYIPENRIDEADRNLKEAIDINRKSFEINPYEYSNDLVYSLYSLAKFQIKINQHNEAEINYKEALNICRKFPIINYNFDIKEVDIMGNLANLQVLLKNNTEAEMYFLEAINKRKEYLKIIPDNRKDLNYFKVGDNFKGLAYLFNDLALLKFNSNQYNEAKIYFIEALDSFKNITSDANFGIIDVIQDKVTILNIFRKLEEIDPDKYINDIAITLCDIGNLKIENNNYDETDQYYIEALKIYKELAKTNNKYLFDVSKILNYLAIIQFNTNRYSEAETNYNEALSIINNLSENNHQESHLSNKALILFNLANLQQKIKLITEAEINYKESLGIRKELAVKNYYQYILDVSTTLIKLADVQSELKYHEEAITNYSEALKIKKELSELNRDVNLADIAYILSNLAVQQVNTSKVKEAINNINEALEIRRELVELNSDMYLPDLAWTLNYLAYLQAYLQTDTNNDQEAINNYTEALEIYRKLVESNPRIYIDIAATLGDLANLQTDTKNYIEAETNYNEALDYYKLLSEMISDTYFKYVIQTIKNLIFVKEILSKTEEAEELKKELSKLQDNKS